MREKPKVLKWLVVLFLLMTTTSSMAQQKNISGQVRDENSEPLIGVTIKLKGSGQGTVTDLDGHFKLQAPADGILEISYIGYKRQEVAIAGRTTLTIKLESESTALDEVVVVAYGTTKKETLTGAISSVKTEEILRSPNANITNTLAGSISGVSTVAQSGQPGKEDTKIFIRGIGSLTEDGSSPLILVDGVERTFSDMDPNEIENITVLKDASATAVFGVRGANGVILVTTRRGTEGAPKISITSNVGVQQYTRIMNMADSYTFAICRNEMSRNDGATKDIFDAYSIERFRLGDEPYMYPNLDQRNYVMKKAAIQTQHNVNVSGGTTNARYFISAGYLYQDGLFKKFSELGYDAGYSYNRFNYRANLDLDVTKTTLLRLGVGGVLGLTHEPYNAENRSILYSLSWSQPFVSPGIVDGKLISVDAGNRYSGIYPTNGLSAWYNRGYKDMDNNTMNLDLVLTQKLDMVTKGLSVEVKGAYNNGYTYTKNRQKNTESYTVFYKSQVDGSGLVIGDPGFDKTLVYRITGQETNLGFSEKMERWRNWYFEASLRYNRKFGSHSVGALLLYNQTKKYYPDKFVELPSGYVGLVGRVTYDYKSKYLAEFNIGYNGSENFAPDKRYGTFPALSLGWLISEEEFMKNQRVIQFLKLRASAGLVGNDNIGNNRYLYLSNSYDVNKWEYKNEVGNRYGYNFGYNNPNDINSALEQRIGNPDVTWEKAFKQNYGFDLGIFENRLKLSVDFFKERRWDILITRQTVPLFSGFTKTNLPVVNMGKVNNQGMEATLRWEDGDKDFRYWAEGMFSYAKNKIIFQDEVEPNEPYMWRTGNQVGAFFGYKFERFYQKDDFDSNGKLKDGLPVPDYIVSPGDCKYVDLNNDGRINPDDVCNIGYSSNPNITVGLNLGGSYKGFFATMNWTGVAQRTLQVGGVYRQPLQDGTRSLMQWQADRRWTPETAHTATVPRFSLLMQNYNSFDSSLWGVDGSYIRLKNATVGYSFRNYAGLKRLGINQLDLKLSGYNLLTFDKFKILDPESTPSSSELYPVIKQYVLSVNLNF